MMRVIFVLLPAPSGVIQNIRVVSTTKDGANVRWNKLPCEERGGVLLYYLVEVYALPDGTLSGTYAANTTTYFVDGLLPYRRYGVRVMYFNDVGSSGHSNLTEFQTQEDGKLYSEASLYRHSIQRENSL